MKSAEDGLPAWPDGIGKVATIPVNIAVMHSPGKEPGVVISGIPQKEGEMPSPDGVAKPADQKSAAINAVLRDAAEAVFTRLAGAMASAARKPRRFQDWRQKDALRHIDPVAAMIGPAFIVRQQFRRPHPRRNDRPCVARIARRRK